MRRTPTPDKGSASAEPKPHHSIFPASHFRFELSDAVARQAARDPSSHPAVSIAQRGKETYDTLSTGTRHKAASMGHATEVPQYTFFETQHNAYGALINAGMRDGFGPAASRFALAVVVSWLLQAFFCVYIYGIARSTCDKADLMVWDCVMHNRNAIQCTKVGTVIEWAALVVFSALMSSQIPPICRAIQLITGASAVRESGAQQNPLQIKQDTRIMLLIFGPLAEFVILVLFFVSGILFIFQSTTNEEVIRSTVSLCFVLQIDEGLYSAVVPESRKQILESMQFGVEEPQRAGNGPGLIVSYLLYFHIYVLIFGSLIIVISMRRNCGDGVFVWNNEVGMGSFTGIGL